MTFCAQCQTYLTPDTAPCPTCGTSCPAADTVSDLWSQNLDQAPAGPPLVAGDLLLLPTHAPPAPHSALHALDLSTGYPRWHKTFQHALVSGIQTSEILKTSEVLLLIATSSTDLLRGQGALLALDKNGNELWRWSPGAQRISAPVIIRSNDFSRSLTCLTVDARTLVMLNLAHGDERAKIPLDASASLCAPTVAEGVAYVPCRGPHLLAVNLDGLPHWRYDETQSPRAWLDQTPLVIGEYLLAVLSTGEVLALRTRDGALAWRVRMGPAGKRLSAPASDGQRLYVGTRDGLHALNLGDGHEAWYHPTPRRVEAAPVVSDGVVYAAGHDHHLYALDAASGQELWRYEVRRRVEMPPAISPRRAFIADRGGTLTALARPLSAAEHEAAAQWVQAASAYAALGQLERGAELLAAHGEPFKAAQLWRAADEPTRAATQYEAAGAWDKAAALWGRLTRPLKQAEALEQHARALSGGPQSDEEQAAAWHTAARAFEAEGETARAAVCQREIARCLRQPIITLDVEHEGLVVKDWSHLQFTVRNEGHGPARDLVIRASGEQFEGQVMATRQIATLRPGRQRTERLDVYPLQSGDSVPLRVLVEYQDHARQAHTRQQTIHIAVARSKATRRKGQIDGVFVAGRGLDYGRGLCQLRKLLNARAPAFLEEFHVLEARLAENLDRERQYGSTETTRAERAAAVGALNNLTDRARLESSFNDLCRE